MTELNMIEVEVLAGDLRGAGADVVRKAEQAVSKTAFDIQASAQYFAPVDTGLLRSSISVQTSGLSASIGPTANYGIYVEMGTYKMMAQPYLFPALDRHEQPFLEAIASLGDDIL